jgi:hypothetical protein
VTEKNGTHDKYDLHRIIVIDFKIVLKVLTNAYRAGTHRVGLGMTVWVRVLDHLWILVLMSAGSNLFLHTRLNPHPPHKKSGLGVGFVFHPLVHLKSEKKIKTRKKVPIYST